MKKWAYFFILFFALSQPFRTLYAREILTLPHVEKVLPNGLRIYMVKFPSPGAVSYQLPVRVGSRNEVEKGKTGFAHFFEHLMFRGTKTLSAKEFGDLYTRLGIENNAWTWFDMTNYHGISASIYLKDVLSAEADRFMSLYFDEKSFKDEAGAVLGEYNKDIAQPEFILEEKLLELAFQSHSYGHTTMGYKADILKFTLRYQDVWPFFKKYYRPSNVAIVLVGDFDFELMEKFIELKFGPWRDPQIPENEIPKESLQKGARYEEVKLSKPIQTRIAVGYKVPPYTTSKVESASLEVIAEMAFSVVSRFQKVFLFDKKWIDEVQATPVPMRDPGLWTIRLRLSQSGETHQKELLRALDETIETFKEKELSQEKINATKKRLLSAATTNWFSSPESLANQIAWFTSFETDLNVLNRHFKQIESVTINSINEFAKNHLSNGQKNTVVLIGEQVT